VTAKPDLSAAAAAAAPAAAPAGADGEPGMPGGHGRYGPVAVRRPVPPLGPPPKAKQPTAKERVLAGGLQVVAIRRPGVPLVELRLRLPFGSTAEAHPARASLLGESLLSGTARRSRQELAEALQAVGGHLSCAVDSDRLLIAGAVLKAGLPAMLDLVADILTGANYPAREVALERDRMLENLSIVRSQPSVLAREALRGRMYGNHPYGREVPEPETVAATTPAQLRRLHADRLIPAGATLVLVGDVSPARVLDRVESVLAEWKHEGRPRELPPLPALTPGVPRLVHRAGSVQSSIRLGGPAPRRDDPGYPALHLANFIYGGYFSSRLVENIREDKGYTYSPHSRVEHAVAGSTLTVEADVATEVTAPALLEIDYELGRLATLPASQQELDDVRQYAIGTLALATATQAGLASMLSGLAGTGLGLEWLREYPGRLAKVTRDEAFEAARKWLAPAALVTVVLGDLEQIAAPLALLGPLERVGAP
jgi:predicted Zn-dependent peptidase